MSTTYSSSTAYRSLRSLITRPSKKVTPLYDYPNPIPPLSSCLSGSLIDNHNGNPPHQRRAPNLCGGEGRTGRVRAAAGSAVYYCSCCAYVGPPPHPHPVSLHIIYTERQLTHHTRHVIVKLLAFTFAMVVVPIGSYFLTLNWVFDGKPSPSPPLPLPLPFPFPFTQKASRPLANGVLLSIIRSVIKGHVLTPAQATPPTPAPQPQSWPTSCWWAT